MKLYTMKDVMGILNVTRMTLLSWEEKGKLHPVRTPGGRRRFSFSARLYGARGGRKVKQCLTELAKGGD